jgi:hypothetical protein
MPSDLLRLVALPALASLGCATIINGSTQDVEITSSPAGASVLILPENTKAVTPTEVELDREKVHTLLFQLEGCRDATAYLDRDLDHTMLGNVIFGGLIGIIVDHNSGAIYQLVPDPLHVVLEHEPLQTSATPDTTTAAARCLLESTPPD